MHLPVALIVAVVLAALVVGLRIAALLKARRTGRVLRGMFVGRPVLQAEDPEGFRRTVRTRTIELAVVVVAIVVAFAVVLTPDGVGPRTGHIAETAFSE
jgi:hypothetical protein